MSFLLPGKNYNQRGLVHLPSEICRTLIGGGAGGYHAGNEPKVVVRYDKALCGEMHREKPGTPDLANSRPTY